MKGVFPVKKFNVDFLVGAATAAHQVEGNNTGSDCWALEQMQYSSYAEPSLDAIDHYHHYEEDIRLLAAAGLNAYRFSVEWARVEPQDGVFDSEQIEHYRRVLACCREYGVEPIVTLHHFSNPKWLIAKGGWEAESTVQDFADYVRYVAEQLGKQLHYVCTINEANIGMQIAALAEKYRKEMEDGSSVQLGVNLEKMMAEQKVAAAECREIFGTDTPQCFTSPRTPKGDLLIMHAHCAARNVIRQVCPELKVGLTLSLHDFQPLPGGEAAAEKEWEQEFTHYLPYIQDDDFIGVQNYTRALVTASGTLLPLEEAELTQMNYEFYPQALENVIRRVAKDFRGELLVTENGIAVTDDTRRVEFIRLAAEGVQHCLADGLPVKSYLYWSLLDNFEWQKGFGITFGLIAVDRATQWRQPKPSLAFLGSLLDV